MASSICIVLIPVFLILLSSSTSYCAPRLPEDDANSDSQFITLCGPRTQCAFFIYGSGDKDDIYIKNNYCECSPHMACEDYEVIDYDMKTYNVYCR
ncbi:hypothetical protein [Trichoplusia ni ascovirus 2c]|uniref:hypothetical protein n=1 Tax=Trichoplusia ni ascovirus 2c TaxID=328615 RepID=UPI0000E44277|nr:hypothetical protein TNAV2c_gp163 [Trichoplusia ni ascovirus 2c]ABF70678.1 hypothetical protein [Trichoplusia ni ascovirus 2c]AUS94273.1 hypothetical protein [Trichoplusia ni ascovirus 6b]